VRALLITLLCGAIGLSGFQVSSATAAQPPKVTQRLHRAIDQLPVAAETRKGYDRSRFQHWVDADDDCQDTRDEVLAAESLVAVSGCDIQQGKWLSYYDGVTTVLSTGFDVDHLVPLAEAWDSGAKRWNAATRRRFANDLRDTRTLVAVTASSNRSKSDRDPAEWMPSLGACKYVRQWVAVKLRWRLTVDRAEKRALRSLGAGCRNSTITVRRAVVRTSSGGGASDGGAGGGGGGLDPRFDYCYQATAAGYGPYYEGSDPEYGWYIDGDSDGIACE
jgi:hypothetical protein